MKAAARARTSVRCEQRRRTEGEDAVSMLSVRSGSGKAPTPYAHSVQVPGWFEGVLGGLVLCVGMLTAQVLHGTGTLVLEFGRAAGDFLQVILSVMGVVISRGGRGGSYRA